jgi:hypothetical protein
LTFAALASPRSAAKPVAGAPQIASPASSAPAKEIPLEMSALIREIDREPADRYGSNDWVTVF